MIIRKTQMAALQKAAERNFVAGLVERSAKYFPKQWGLLGPAGMQGVVELGVERAAAYDFNFEYSISAYLDAMLLLGSYFDVDFQLPWTAEILTDRSKDQGIRAELLRNAVQKYLNRVAGPDREKIEAALLRVGSEWERLLRIPHGTPLRDHIGTCLKMIHPEKCDVIGKSGMERLLTEGALAADKQGIRIDPGIVIYTGSMFVCGAHFDRDPQFAGFESILTELRRNDPSVLDNLKSEVSKQIDYWVGHPII